MTGPVPVRIVSSAARAIVEAAEWWVAHRTKAPDAFAIELERALQLLASQPSIGAKLGTSNWPMSAVFTFPVFIIICITALFPTP